MTTLNENFFCLPDPDNRKTDHITINSSDFPDAGIIFIRSEDVLSLVFMSIIKQPCTNIGFFYKSSVSGTNKISVILVDVNRFIKPTWLDDASTIEDIISNPLVSFIGIKGLKPILDNHGKIDLTETEKLHSTFRQAIGNVIGKGAEKSFEETISQLFGYEVKHPTGGVTAVEMVNRVIMAMDKWDQVPQEGSLSSEALQLLRAPTLLGCGIESKTKMIQILTSHFNQQEVCNPTVANKLIQSYIVDNGLFSDMMNIDLPQRDPHRVRMAQEATYILNSDYISKAVSTFTTMLIHDDGFYKCVLAGFNQSRLVGSETDLNDDGKQCLFDICNDSESLVKTITHWIQSGEISYSEIISSLVRVDQTRQQISYKYQFPLSEDRQYPTIDNNKLILIKKDSSSEKGNSKPITSSFISLREEIGRLAEQIQAGESPIISINDLIRPLNNISDDLGLPSQKIPLIKGNYSLSASIIVKSDHSEGIPLTLKSGKKIILTLVNPNLNGLSSEDLIDILESLDNMASNDHHFDNLRSIITSKLSYFST